uniref:Uncharacterized protein n=1 Tax=Panagrolaimus superbus TaxID=310955 RepID=A0A914ZDG4_9BILA
MQRTGFACIVKVEGRQCGVLYHPVCRNHRLEAYMDLYPLDGNESDASQVSNPRTAGQRKKRSLSLILVTTMSKVCYEHGVEMLQRSVQAPRINTFRNLYTQRHFVSFGDSNRSATNPLDKTYRQ